MESTKRIIVGKISARRTSAAAKNGNLLISVNNGKISEIIRECGKYDLVHDNGREWYFVDENEYKYDCSYVGGGISLDFTFSAAVAFPTLIIYDKNLLGKDMTEVVKNWGSSGEVSNIITGFLIEKSVKSENMLSNQNYCKQLEEKLRVKCREHFIKNWGMLLESVSIRKKASVSATPYKEYNPYDYII